MATDAHNRPESVDDLQGQGPVESQLDDSAAQLGDRESILLANNNDLPDDQDKLGFSPYVAALSEFLTSPHTTPPLTLSIEGGWGSGKSSFMKQLKRAIEESIRGLLSNAMLRSPTPSSAA